MHLEHIAGKIIMIDFAGKKLSYVDTVSGELIACQVFVAVLPHSGLVFCHAVHAEPTGGTATEKKLPFVVQQHNTWHLDFDFRLMLRGWITPLKFVS